MREHVVGDEQGARLDLRPGEVEEGFVVLLLRIDEDEVEDVVDRKQRFEGVGLEREDAAAERADSGREPDGRVAARAAQLEYLAVRLRRHQREQKLIRRSRHLARPLRRRHAALSLVGVLRLETREYSADAVV